MVSTDGPSVTPDDGDSGGKKPTETKQASSRSTRDLGPVARGTNPVDTKSGIENIPVAQQLPANKGPIDSPEPTTDSTDPAAKVADQPEQKTEAPGKKQKPLKQSRRQRKISRLVMEFQPDAVEMEHRKVAGGLRWTLYVAISLLAAAIAWAYWAKVDRVVTAEGKLISVAEFTIEAPSTSPIRTVVQFGDTVKAGQVLATLDPTFSEADVAKLETRQNSLVATVSRLTAEQQKLTFEITGHETDPVWLTEKMLFQARQREMTANDQQFDAEYRKLQAQKARNNAEVQSRRDLVELRKKTVAQSRELRKKNAIPKNELMENEAELKYAYGQLVTSESTVLETDADFDVLAKQREARFAERMSQVSLELAQARQSYNEILEDLNKARFADQQVVIKAPDDFPEYKVVEMANRNTIVQPGEAIMRLVPVNAELEVEIKIENKDIALIRDKGTGEARDVRVKLAAYPFMKHGTLSGRVKTINEDITEEGQPGMTRAYYTVRISIDMESVGNLKVFDDGKDYATIQPGMAATAEIKVGTRSVLDYFLYPLMKSVETSIREP